MFFVFSHLPDYPEHQDGHVEWCHQWGGAGYGGEQLKMATPTSADCRAPPTHPHPPPNWNRPKHSWTLTSVCSRPLMRTTKATPQPWKRPPSPASSVFLVIWVDFMCCCRWPSHAASPACKQAAHVPVCVYLCFDPAPTDYLITTTQGWVGGGGS